MQTLSDHRRYAADGGGPLLGVAVQIEKITDYAVIAGYGVVSTPGIVIDETLVHAGGLPKPEELAKWLTA